MSGFHPAVSSAIVTRDGGSCARCGMQVAHLERGRAWSIHHRRPRGKGGTRLAWVSGAANGVILCGSGTTGCHGWVESHRAEATMSGFLVSLNGVRISAEVAIRHAILGLVYLDDSGGWCPVEEGPTPDSMWGAAA